jgi:hypothetical protein
MNTTDLLDMTITDVLELAPEGTEYSIVDADHANIILNDGRSGRIWWDDSDANNTGWAYQVDATGSKPEESGELDTVGDISNVLA